MDELIYILIFVAYIGYSIYNAMQKSKAKQLEKQQQQQPEQDYEEEGEFYETPQPAYETPRPERPVRSLFEELLKEAGIEPEPVAQPQPVAEPTPNKYSQYNYIVDEKEPMHGDLKTMKPASLRFERSKEEEEAFSLDTQKKQTHEFDLKKAIIYSTILERPYS